MNMDTGKLIERLGESAGPVRPIPRVWRRAAIWLALAIPYIALVVVVVSPRSDLMMAIHGVYGSTLMLQI